MIYLTIAQSLIESYYNPVTKQDNVMKSQSDWIEYFETVASTISAETISVVEGIALLEEWINSPLGAESISYTQCGFLGFARAFFKLHHPAAKYMNTGDRFMWQRGSRACFCFAQKHATTRMPLDKF